MQRTLLISYVLSSPEDSEDYGRVIEKIKEYSPWAKPLKSVWLIKTSENPAEIRDELKKVLDLNDRLLVIDVTNSSWATYKIKKSVTDWIKDYL